MEARLTLHSVIQSGGSMVACGSAAPREVKRIGEESHERSRGTTLLCSVIQSGGGGRKVRAKNRVNEVVERWFAEGHWKSRDQKSTLNHRVRT